MSSSRTWQCLSCRLKSSALQSVPRRQFHASAPTKARHRPKFRNVKASEMEQTAFRPYTAREKQLLALKYSPEQMKAIEAGEAAISSEEIEKAKVRTDPMRIKYLDDFAEMRPILDRPLQAGDLVQENKKDDKKQEPASRRPQQQSQQDNPEDMDPHLLRLMQQTGFTQQEIRRIRVKNLVSHRVVNQTRMGKIQSLYFLTIAGNENGLVGVGEGKAAEDEDGRRQAMMNAIRNMRPIARYEERTIFGDVQAKVGASVVQLFSRPPGFGNRCQHLIFELARAAGISDLAARTPRSRNKMNVVKAAFEALTSQRLPEDVAKGRGRKMVDARKVYYGGQVL